MIGYDERIAESDSESMGRTWYFLRFKDDTDYVD